MPGAPQAGCGWGPGTGGPGVVALWRLSGHGGVDLPGELSAALQEAARAVGGAEALVRARPGSWEASDVGHLAYSDADFDW